MVHTKPGWTLWIAHRHVYRRLAEQPGEYLDIGCALCRLVGLRELHAALFICRSKTNKPP